MSRTIFAGSNLFDGETRSADPMSVVVDGDRIAQVGAGASVDAQPDDVVIDARGFLRVVWCVVFVACCWLCVVCCALFAVLCLLCVVCRLLRCALFDAVCLLCAVRCMLLVVCVGACMVCAGCCSLHDV